MVTYNHEEFIARAIESVMMQQTDFHYVLFIGEDGSKDDTASICRRLKEKFPARIALFINKENIGATKNARNIYRHCFESGAEYIAMLEGDDYWTDPLKLQKQVDALRKFPRLVLSHTDVATLDPTGQLINEHGLKSFNYQRPSLGYGCTIFFPIAFTCTAVYRNVLPVKSLPQGIVAGDWALWVLLTLKGDAAFINEKTAVYRLGYGLSENTQWHEDYRNRSVFLLRQASLRYSVSKNLWLIKGALYFLLLRLSRQTNLYTFHRIAKSLRYRF